MKKPKYNYTKCLLYLLYRVIYPTLYIRYIILSTLENDLFKVDRVKKI